MSDVRSPRSARATWTIVIPVKPAATGKSRLGGAPELARAIALDSIEAVARSSRVRRVVIVTADAELERDVATLRAVAQVVLVREPEVAGIGSAIRAGLAASDADAAPRAALLGDVPALEPAELDAVLARAEGEIRAFLPDADGTGTVLVTAAAGVDLIEAFGPESAAAHRARGLVELQVDAASGLRRDVDTPEQLAEVVRRVPDSRTARVAQAV